MKKLIALSLILLMLCLATSPALAEGTELTASAAVSGKTVTYTFSLSGGDSISGFSLLLNYDESLLSPDSISFDSRLNNGMSLSNLQSGAAEGGVTAVWLTTGSVSGDGKLFTVSFTLKSGSTAPALTVSGDFSDSEAAAMSYTVTGAAGAPVEEPDGDTPQQPDEPKKPDDGGSTGTVARPKVTTPAFSRCVATMQKITFNAKNISLEVYNIDGANYFKLRDLAYLLINSESQFEVGFDLDKLDMLAYAGKPYTPVGGELATGTDRSASCVISRWMLNVDGDYREAYTYNIGGNNFFKLRDLAAIFGFGVDYDQLNNTAIITCIY